MVFKRNGLFEYCSARRNFADLRDRFSAGDHHVAYTIVSSRNSRDIYYASGSSGYDPVYTLQVLGQCDSATINYSEDNLSDGAKGVRKFLRAIDETHKITLTEVAPKDFYLPKPGENVRDYFHYVSLAFEDFSAYLSKKYKTLDWSEKVVDDIRSLVPSTKTKEGGYQVSGMTTVHRLYMAAAFTILRKRGGERTGVVALIVDKQGRIISWGMKNDVHWHGETAAVMQLFGKIPAGSVVYTTLKPCNMCAGLIADASGGDIQVYWGQHDPADAAKGTALDQSRCGHLLDGNKFNGGARAILIGAKPKSGDRDERKEMGRQLGDKFDAWKRRKDNASTIDFIVTEEASKITLAVESMLVNKFKKYEGSTGGNENTARVINYLVEFLRNLGVAPDALR